MNYGLWSLVIFVTFLGLYFGVGAVLKRGQARLDRLLALDQAAQAVARVEQLPRAGRFPVEYLPGPPFAGAQDRGYEFNTGPLLLLSDKAAANVALERDVRAMIEAGEEKIPPRWRS